MTMHGKLDVVLVNPGGRLAAYQSLGHKLSAVESPVWAGLIATFLRGRGCSVEVLDANAEDLDPSQAAGRIQEMDPLLAALVVYGHNPSASTQVMPAASETCAALRQLAPDVKSVMVGGHVAALPERTLREEAVDFACAGEGPYMLLDLVHALRAGEPREYGKVRDLWYRQDGAILAGPAAPLVTDLDGEMRGMAWDLLPMHAYRAHNWHCWGGLDRQPYAAIYTTLGCPFRCSFCCIQAPFKSGEKALGYREGTKSYRRWSPQAVIEQIDTLVNVHGVRNIKFADEIFVLKPSHVTGICELIIERGYDLNIWAYARVDTMREGMADLLKRAGVNWLALGIEAASERVRDDARKGYGQRDLVKAIDAIRAAGIYIIGNYIFGLPEDDLATMQETLDLALDLNAEYANLYSAMAYPGSGLYNTAVEKGWPLPESWTGYSQYAVDTLPLPTNHVTGAEVLRFRDRAFQTYYASPKYLEMVARTYGEETVKAIRGMTAHQLVRKHA